MAFAAFVASLEVPNHNPTIDSSGADLADLSCAAALVCANFLNGVLMHRPELGVVDTTATALEVHAPEHIQRALFAGGAGSCTRSSLLERTRKLPARRRARESVDSAVVASTDNLALADPEKVGEWKKLCGHCDDCLRRLLRRRWIHYCDAAVVGSEGKSIARWREGNAVDPASSRVEELAADGVERQSLAPSTWLRTLVRAFDEARQDSSMSIRRSSCQQHSIRMPCHSCDSRSKRLLQVLAHPPIVLLFKVADCNDPRAASNSKLVLQRAPSYTGGSPVDSQQHQSWLPSALRGRLPDVGVAVLRACDDAAAVRCNVNARHKLVVAAKLILEFETRSGGAVELDVVVAGHGKSIAVGGEGVVADGGVEEMVHLRGRHLDVYVFRSRNQILEQRTGGEVSLLPLCCVDVVVRMKS